jgi:hypothetical protein
MGRADGRRAGALVRIVSVGVAVLLALAVARGTEPPRNAVARPRAISA